MPINENISDFIRRYKEEHHLSLAEMAEELGIAKNTVIGCLNGTGNLRADTMDVIAENCGVSVAEIVSAHPRGWERAEIAERAARLFSSLPPEQRDRAISHFLSLVEILSDNHT